MEKDKLTGRFSLDKKLKDGRHSPKNLIVPNDKDVLILDQHTEETSSGDLVNYTKVVGVAKNIKQEDDKLEFDWKVTDPGLLNLINNADHPDKLFKYSPEHIPIDKDEKYDQGKTGMLEHIAITNLANDDQAITTRIYNRMKDMFKSEDEGENMDEEIKTKIQTGIEEGIKPFNDRLELVDKIQQSLEKVDFEKLNELVEKLPELEKVLVKTEDMEKNIQKMDESIKNISQAEIAEKEELIKNVKTNSGISEDALKIMSKDELEKLNEKFTKNTPGVGETSEPTAKSIVDEINAQYGTDVGSTLFKDDKGDL